MIRFSMVLPALLAVAACQREPSQPSASRPTVALTARAANPLQVNGAARMDGYADLRFGMTANEIEQGARMSLHRTAANGICSFLTPRPPLRDAPVAFMIEADKFVRYDVANGNDSAPGGGKVGMSVEQIEQLYPGQVRELPSAAGGRALRVKGDAGVAIVYEISGDGRVSRWRVGQMPQVEYSQGCS